LRFIPPKRNHGYMASIRSVKENLTLPLVGKFLLFLKSPLFL
jgi:hypothetical protein